MSSSAARVLSQTQVITKSVANKSAEIIYARFPQFSAVEEVDRKYFASFVTAVGFLGFLALLGINTLLAQDAFTLSQLKQEAKLVADQRDAVNRQIDAHSAPEALAKAASKLGMKPSETPIFLSVAPVESDITHG